MPVKIVFAAAGEMLTFLKILLVCSPVFQLQVGFCAVVKNKVSCKDTGCPSGQKCILDNCVLDVSCPPAAKYGPGPPSSCSPPSDPNSLPPSPLESWFTKEIFHDLFPKANIGWGPHECQPYSYETFIIAARYFPKFGVESPNNGYTKSQNNRRDLAAFFAHAVQETGENDASLYKRFSNVHEAHACFYRGGFFNWFEGGPTSSFLPPATPGYHPADGVRCNGNGRYCARSAELDYWYPCNDAKDGKLNKGCYFGRGAIQISYNYNYGQFNDWLKSMNISIDLLQNPNLVMTKMDPPLAILASLWFYMTPQPPKPAMHDIIMGNWNPGRRNEAAGYQGPIFGPTSLIINNECNGENPSEPGGPGESRRIKAFKWFTEYFGAPIEPDHLLSCKDMPLRFAAISHNTSYQPDWITVWKDQPCNCVPAIYGGMVPYFQKGFYPQNFVNLNQHYHERCVKSLYEKPELYGMHPSSSACLNIKPASTIGPNVSTANPSKVPVTTTNASCCTPTNGGDVIAVPTETGRWTNSEGRQILKIKLTITNKRSRKICDALIQMTPAGHSVQTVWGVVSTGRDGVYRLPSWISLNPGKKYDGIGIIVVGDNLPTFTVLHVTNC